MKSFTVSSIHDEKNVVRVCLSVFSNLMPNDMYKALRKKDVRINGKKISRDTPVFEGDQIEIWLPDSAFEAPLSNSRISDPRQKNNGFSDYKVVYESDNLLMLNKRQGLAVHPGKGVSGNTLIDIVREDQKNPSINLCHRIDMNTGGLIMLAKNKESLEDATALFRKGFVTKRYRCLVKGIPAMGEPCICTDETVMKEIRAFLEKTPGGNVFIHDKAQERDLAITTRYRIVKTFPDAGPEKEPVSDLEVELVTGRTHQIRAHFAHLGHPILGDGNYGRNQYNRFFHSTNGGKILFQQLFSSSLFFGQIPKSNLHSALSNRSFNCKPAYDLDFYTE